MPLTPEDVRNKRFTPVRLREGYDMGEVDQFLDEVEAELERLTTENDDLRTQLAAAQDEAAQRPPAPVEAPQPVEPVVEEAPAVIEEPQPPAPVAAAPASVAEASTAAARLLEIATRNADELVADAKDQADRIVAEARTKAERLEAESRTKAERLESDARTRAERLDAETTDRRQQLFGELEKARDRLNAEVEDLRAFEREYRSRLRNYFESQLAQLNGSESVVAPLPGPGGEGEHAPKRLKSLLGEDE